ncbi:MAG: hypothetical protein PHN73_04895 [Eubacteriales bacterium]|nr:hypothetical protein [Eubacteriales bacterium]
MTDKSTGKSGAKRLYRLSYYVILIALLITIPFSSYISFGKYVLEPITYTTALYSSEAFTVTSIGAITGNAQIAQTLTAGNLTPASALVDYKWQRAATSGGIYTDISGATSNTYTLTASDKDYYIKVIATGKDGYTGIVSSQYTGPVEAIPVTGIGTISGIAQVSKTLTAGTLVPSGATANYKWQRAATSGDIYVDISGASSSTYTLAPGDKDYYIRVVATGFGSYEGSVSSAYKGPIAAGFITAIGPISGTTTNGQTLTAGTLTPFGATATYQWQRNINGTGFVNITGATASTYTLTGADQNSYIRVIATGIGAYTGTVTSEFVGLVGAQIIPITSMGPIGGTSQVGKVLSAGLLEPSSATATYLWQRCDTPNGTYVSIEGATSNTYTLQPEDKDKYIKVTAVGSGTFSGTLTSNYRGPVAAGVITAIGQISGTTAVGEILTAGTLSPPNATVTYQWQRSLSTNGTYENITGATSSTYTLTSSDQGYFLKVTVTGYGTYTDTAASAYTGPVSITVIPLTDIGVISGITQVGKTLTAGSLSPAGATATYQWMRSDYENGDYENIPGATSSTYTLTANDMGHYFKVQAIGSNTYSGTVIGAGKGPVSAAEITAIGPISGTTTKGQTLTVGTLTPYGATATYKWQRSDGIEPFTDIVGGTASSYTLTGLDNYRYIRVVATGYGAYTGVVISEFVGRVTDTVTPITSIGGINGNAEVGQVLTAGTLSPAGAMATYQWMRCDTHDGTYEIIIGSTGFSYTLNSADKDKYIKVIATGASNYSGSVTSTNKGPVAAGQVTAIGSISGTTTVGQTLSAGTLSPYNATVDYQWQRAMTSGGSYSDIANANAGTYTITTEDEGYYIRVVAIGTGAYTGTAISAYTGPVSVTAAPLTGIGVISGTAEVSKTLTAGPLTPAGATATYQWMKADTSDGTYEIIPGATGSTYTLTSAEKGQYIKAQAIASGAYSGTVTSAFKGPVAAAQITAISSIIGTTSKGQTLSVGTLTPYGATATYQWQRSDDGSGFVNIVGGTASTYTLGGEDSYKYIRVVATGYGAYTGTVYSGSVGRVTGTVTPLTAIGSINGLTEVGQILTVGPLTPAGTATYQWQRSDTENGAYVNIPGAVGSTYSLNASDKDKYIKVVAQGSGAYSGIVTSTSKGPVAAGQVTAIGNITGTTTVGETLSAGTLVPPDATVTYQWKRCDTPSGTYEDIPGANSVTYTLTAGDEGYYIKVTATGYGDYTGSVTSNYSGPVTNTTTAITSIGAISGTAQVAKTLTAGMISPAGATVTYQWLRCNSPSGEYEYIHGATESTYTLSANDKDKYIKVQVTSSGTYSGTETSTYVGPVALGQITAISPIMGTTKAGEVLTAGTVSPNGATVTYQWQRSNNAGGTFTNLVGATSNTYLLSTADNGSYIRVEVTGTGAFTGSAASASTGPVKSATTPVTAIGAVSGNTEVGEILTAGNLTPANATVTYQWQHCSTSNGDFANITGQVSSTYVLTESDVDKYIRVVVKGSGNFTGTVESASVGPVTSIQGMGMMMPLMLMEEITTNAAITEDVTTSGAITEEVTTSGAAVIDELMVTPDSAAVSGAVQIDETPETSALYPVETDTGGQTQNTDTPATDNEALMGTDLPEQTNETSDTVDQSCDESTYSSAANDDIAAPEERSDGITEPANINGADTETEDMKDDFEKINEI